MSCKSDGSDGNSSNSITFTRTCVPYYIHVRKEFKKSGVITVTSVTDFEKKSSSLKHVPLYHSSLQTPMYRRFEAWYMVSKHVPYMLPTQ